MRVLLVSPASHEGSPAEAGGIAGYVADLARRLAVSGVTPAIVNAGHVYQPGVLGRGIGRCRVQELGAIDGVRRFQVVNSPVVAPSLWQFGSPEDETSNAALERVFGAVCRAFRPDVVHVHGFEGFSAGIVGVARRSGARVVFSVHNYHAFCPQVYLLRGRRVPCVDYDGGDACERCEQAIDVSRERIRRATGVGPAPHLEPPPRAPVMTFDRSGEPTGATLGLWGYGDPLWQPTDRYPDALASRDVRGRYGARRASFVRALNACDVVAAVSSASGEICARMGVDGALIEVMPIGSWAAAVPASARPVAPAEALPLRLVYLGFGSYPKGLGVLCDALGLLTPDYRRRVHLAAHGTGVREELSRLEGIRSGLAGADVGDRYARREVVSLLSGIHAAVVPSVWHDNGPQTAIEARALGVPVIGSRIGGIPEIIREGEDGVLFRANDRADLARVIAGLVRESGRLAAIRGRVRPWSTMSEHADAMGGLYRRVLSSASVRRGHAESEQV